MDLEILDFWHCGQGSAALPEAPVERDAQGLPCVPARSLRALLREAVADGESLGHLPEGTCALLFGGGALRLSDARMPAELRGWLCLPEQEACRRALSREWVLVAEGETRSRRALEVIVPMRLEAEISILPDAHIPPDWNRLLAAALPLAGAVGALRSRGLGRCRMSLREPA